MRCGLGACFVVLGACGGGSSSPLSPASQAPATAWVRLFGGVETQNARVVRLAAIGDRVVAVGRVHGAISFDGIVVGARVPQWSDGGFFLVLDGAGRAVAARRLDGAEAFPFDVADLSLDALGHAYVVGVHAAMQGRESYLQKLDLAGQVAWTRAWRPPPLSVPHTAGGFDSGCLRVAADDAAVFVAGNDDAVTFVEKRNDAGDVVWRREVAHATGLDCPEIAADGEGGVVVAGGYAVGADHFDLVRFDPSGHDVDAPLPRRSAHRRREVRRARPSNDRRLGDRPHGIAHRRAISTGGSRRSLARRTTSCRRRRFPVPKRSSRVWLAKTADCSTCGVRGPARRATCERSSWARAAS